MGERSGPDVALLRVAAILGAIAVAAGAFGAHGLEGRVPPQRIDTFDTGARLLLAHVPVLLIVALLRERFAANALRWAASLLLTGVIVFSGSLFALVLLDMPWLGAVTPIGGVSLIAGWFCLAWGVGRSGER